MRTSFHTWFQLGSLFLVVNCVPFTEEGEPTPPPPPSRERNYCIGEFCYETACIGGPPSADSPCACAASELLEDCCVGNWIYACGGRAELGQPDPPLLWHASFLDPDACGGGPYLPLGGCPFFDSEEEAERFRVKGVSPRATDAGGTDTRETIEDDTGAGASAE